MLLSIRTILKSDKSMQFQDEKKKSYNFSHSARRQVPRENLTASYTYIKKDYQARAIYTRPGVGTIRRRGEAAAASYNDEIGGFSDYRVGDCDAAVLVRGN